MFKSGKEIRAGRAAKAAQAAWDAGDLAFVHFEQAVGPAGEHGLGRQVSEVLDIGWVLAGTALAYADKFQQAMFTFIRP